MIVFLDFPSKPAGDLDHEMEKKKGARSSVEAGWGRDEKAGWVSSQKSEAQVWLERTQAPGLSRPRPQLAQAQMFAGRG